MLLFLMRHATAQKLGKDGDFERRLTGGGEIEAQKASKYVSDKNYKIDKITISPAIRAKETAISFIESYPGASLNFVSELYDSQMEDIKKKVYIYARSRKNHLIIGHNPIMYELVCELCQQDQEQIIKYGMLPSQIVVIEAKVKDGAPDFKLQEIIPPLK